MPLKAHIKNIQAFLSNVFFAPYEPSGGTENRPINTLQPKLDKLKDS
jgi:hypothetical protein